MKTLISLLLFVGLAFVGLVLSSILTLIAWNIQIEHRAFRCTDDVGFGFFWEDMKEHQAAGDTVLSGWTWEKIKIVKTLYVVVFLIGAALPAALVFWGEKKQNC